MKQVKRIIISSVAALFLTSSITVIAQWNKKPSTEWTSVETRKLLSDSPWSKTQNFLTVVDTPIAGSRNPDFDRPRETTDGTFSIPHQIYFRICLFSAKPIREALSRTLAQDIDERVKDQTSSLLDDSTPAELDDRIVILVSAASQKESFRLQEAQSSLNKYRTEDLKPNTYLEVKGGKRVYLSEYRSYGSLGSVFIFPRSVDGEPFITAESGELHFHSQLSKTFLLDARYKTKDMIYQGKLEY